MKTPNSTGKEKEAEDQTEVKKGPVFLFAAGIFLLFIIFLFIPVFTVQFLSLFLFLLLLGSKAYSEYLIRNLKIIRFDCELRSFRNEWVQIEIAAENRGILPAFMLALSDSPGMLPVFRNNKSLFTLNGRSRLLWTWQGLCTHRGIFMLGPANIRCADPLGLFPFQLKTSQTCKLFVYPCACFASVKAPQGIPLGALISPNPLFEDLTRSRSLREYQPGDEIRRINWKATARQYGGTFRFMINEYEAAFSYPLVIFLNLSPQEYPLKNRELYLERVIETAAALCLMAGRDRQELGIIFYTSSRADGLTLIESGPLTITPILERLAGLERYYESGQTNKAGETLNSNETTSSSSTYTEGAAHKLHNSAERMLEAGKFLPYGTRLIYTGSKLSNEDYILINSLKTYRFSLEFFIIDEQVLSPLVPGNSPLYQIKEQGYEII
ncbi:MAG: DUF58 domain-containing protein [Treponema sp.]|jgi:uncharacterized protein (DUF58 family)|nr:DUF58 domain-containing protein [Treponema sp.]